MTNILLTDRTTIETDWTCGMKRWWYKEYGGKGIVPTVEAAYFLDGRQYHEDFALLSSAIDVLATAQDHINAIMASVLNTPDQLFQETQTRRAGWMAANALFFEPFTRLHYDTVDVEWELILDRTPLWIAVTPDRVLRRKSDGALIYRDYKGVGGWGVTSAWLNSWPYAVQIHTVLKAIEEELDEPVAFGQIVGLSKGQNKDGKLRHPYVWAYVDDNGEGWTSEWKYGLTLRPTWEYPGGILEWVKQLGQSEVDAQFPHSQKVFLNERLLDKLVAERTARELDISTGQAMYESRFSECSPSIGSPCPYLAACHNAAVNTDPLGSGLYVVRTPHHDVEAIMKEE